MSDRLGPQVYSIAAHRGFADALVAGLVPRYSEDGLGLARLTLLLPSGRAIRTVSEAFVRHMGEEGGAGLLLPRMVTIGDLSLDDPRISPLFGDLEDLPPIAIFSGTSDILLVDGRRLAAKLTEEGMPKHAYHEYDGMFHVWMLFPIPEGKRARAETVEFIRGHRKAA